MSALLRKELERVFADSNTILDEKLLPECISICQTYTLSPEELLWKLQAINYRPTQTLSEIIPITMETLSSLKSQMDQKIKESAKKQQMAQSGKRMNKNFAKGVAQVDRSRVPNFMGRSSTGSGAAGGSRGAGITPTSASGSSSTTGAPGTSGDMGIVVKDEAMTVDVPMDYASSSTASVVFVGPKTDPKSKKERAYRYMYEKISERSEALDQIISDFAGLISSHYNISEIGDPSISTEEDVVVVGRITHDADTAAGAKTKLVEGAIVLESSRYLSAGIRVPLHLDPSLKVTGGVRGSGGFGLYPGEIVAFRGRNGGGGYFLANEFLSMPPLKPSPVALGEHAMKEEPEPKPASIMLACGPFSMDSDLSYKPWKALLNTIKEKKPEVLLLIGPFVDIAHPKIQNGDTEFTPSMLFKAHFADPLRSFLIASPGSIVLIVPSPRDLLTDHAAFPQPELDSSLFHPHPRLHLLPNPSRFSINGISFAVSSVDVLFHLRTEEYFKRGVESEPLPATPNDLPTDAMANLSRHLLLQRSFYPIFPTPEGLSHEVNLDVSHSDAIRMVDEESGLDYAPDVLILPSRLRQFSKLIHTTHTINPSFLSKGTYGNVFIGEGKSVKAEVCKVEVGENVKVERAA